MATVPVSAATALIQTCSNRFLSSNSGTSAAEILLDLMQAFEKVGHTILICHL